ncbi:MAG: TIGR02117 family protein [Flavobacteriia bacterium]|jgi:uncharacterized protein (TIGR02117 family)
MKKHSLLRRVIRIVLKFIIGFIAFILLYLLIAFIFGRIAVGKAGKKSAHRIEVHLINNGMHTDIVMPVKNKYYDWNRTFPIQNTKGKDSLVKLVSVGWGDKGFYLHTPEWSQLKFSTAFKAAFWLSSAAIHVTYYREIPDNVEHVHFYVTPKQYRQLIHYVELSLLKKQRHSIHIRTNAVYGDNDAFYEAKGSYSLLHTCNTWVNSGLKACGQKASLWTPFTSGIFYHYSK